MFYFGCSQVHVYREASYEAYRIRANDNAVILPRCVQASEKVVLQTYLNTSIYIACKYSETHHKFQHTRTGKHNELRILTFSNSWPRTFF